MRFREYAGYFSIDFANPKYRTHNENIVHGSVRYLMEYRQMEQRLRLDLPTLADPIVRDLLHESDLFVRSFMGMGGFGLFSPFDLVRILSIVAELASQLYVLWSTSRGSAHAFVLVILVLPTALSMVASWLPSFSPTSEMLYTPEEAKAAERQERMRTLANSEPYRSEVVLFGLGPWILQSWATARKRILGLESPPGFPHSRLPRLFTPANVSEMFMGLQNVRPSLSIHRAVGHGCFDWTASLPPLFVVDIVRLAGSLPQLCAVADVQHPYACHNGQNGVPEYIHHGRVFCGYGHRAASFPPPR